MATRREKENPSPAMTLYKQEFKQLQQNYRDKPELQPNYR